MQVIRILLKIGVKAMLDGTLDREAARDRDRQRALLTREKAGRTSEPMGERKPAAEVMPLRAAR
jgi:hypothetical protein